MSWCPNDSSYLVTCAKDNRTICWDTVTGEVLIMMLGFRFSHLPVLVHIFMFNFYSLFCFIHLVAILAGIKSGFMLL